MSGESFLIFKIIAFDNLICILIELFSVSARLRVWNFKHVLVSKQLEISDGFSICQRVLCSLKIHESFCPKPFSLVTTFQLRSMRQSLLSSTIFAQPHEEATPRIGKESVFVHAMPEALRQREKVQDSRTSSSAGREENDSSVSLLREEIYKISERSSSRAFNSSDGAAVFMFRLWKEL